MTSRERLPATYQGRSIQAPGTIRHGPFPGGLPSDHRPLDRLSHSDLLENKIAAQAAEIDKLSLDNHRLSASHAILREELVAAEHELQGLKAHIRSIEAESDIQIRVVLEKIVKMEAVIKTGENVKRELQQAHVEAQSLVKKNQELVSRVLQASEELKKARTDAKSLPELISELESLRKEHQRLRSTFEYEKGVNIEQVEKLKAMERNLIGLVREVERLRAELVSAKNRAFAHASYPQPPGYVNGTYFDEYGRPIAQPGIRRAVNGTIPYVSGDGTIPYVSGDGTIPYVSGDGTPVPGGLGNAVWAGPLDPSLVRR